MTVSHHPGQEVRVSWRAESGAGKTGAAPQGEAGGEGTRLTLRRENLTPNRDHQARAERAAMGIEPLPSSLHAAITVMARSEHVAETLGEQIFDVFLRNKQAEWDQYRAQVTPLELRRLLPNL